VKCFFQIMILFLKCQFEILDVLSVLCFWFRALLIYINNCPTRCNTKQSIILQGHPICFGCQPHPSLGVHKTVTTASGTVQLPPSNMLEGGSYTKNMTSTGGCSYSFVYSG